MIHARKILPEYYAAIDKGEKNFEIRSEDEAQFKAGDYLALNEWDGAEHGFTGRCRLFRITCVLRDFPGLAVGYVCLGLTACVVESAKPCGIAPFTRKAWMD